MPGPCRKDPLPVAEVGELSPLMLLPPDADKCQECAVKHEPGQPHDATSLFYHVHFQMQHGHEPNWANAIAHCTPELQAAWTQALMERYGIDVNSSNCHPPKK